ncbi:helix-turn-helix transcriptional regulator [Hirschia maritima]|uniref:helix-turn-helix transcriptional regulator n=1 Tax=Hirschia maritima TaxID=1121961 RepID=UPI0003829189|nr:helix-turn-helix domain-containing protein [Hirschia maritima]
MMRAAHYLIDSSTEQQVSVLPITQATAATFKDLYFRQTSLFFIQQGEKRVENSPLDSVVCKEGDLLICPSGVMLTIENKPKVDQSYRAIGISYSQDLIESVFTGTQYTAPSDELQHVPSTPHAPQRVLDVLITTLKQEDLPQSILHHRLIEPLIWLKSIGIVLPTKFQNQPNSKVRKLIETDLTFEWRAAEVAKHFSMSEATFRRWLGPSGKGFAKILLDARLECGLILLQTTSKNISEIALESGFKTPSHFSDSFRKRFKISPKEIRMSLF